MIDHYKTLQVDSSAEAEIIVAAYRRLALKYHPDTNKSPDATRRMQAINEAYEVLSDSTRRAKYDRMRPSQPDVTRYEREAESARRHAEEEKYRREQAEMAQRRAEQAAQADCLPGYAAGF